MRKILSVILAVLMVTVLAVPAFAAMPNTPVLSPQYTYIRTLSANLTIDEDVGVATCTATCYSESGYTVEITCKLQQYNGSTWVTMKTWTASGSRYASINKDWAVFSGYTYRVYVTYFVRNAAGSIVETTTSTRSYVYPKR